MKQRSPFQKNSRMLIVVLALATLPFLVLTLEKKISEMRSVASDGELPLSSTVFSPSKDLSELSPEDFVRAFKYRMVQTAKIQNQHSEPRVSMGVFLLKNSSGVKVFVCDEFPTVDLIFAANGVAYSGEIPKIILRMPCQITEDQNFIEGYNLPFSQILKSPLSQYEFAATSPHSREEARVYVRGVQTEWPRHWDWVGVKLYGRNNSQLDITGYEIISILGAPVTFEIRSF